MVIAQFLSNTFSNSEPFGKSASHSLTLACCFLYIFIKICTKCGAYPMSSISNHSQSIMWYCIECLFIVYETHIYWLLMVSCFLQQNP